MSIVSEINRIQGAKTALKTAIEDKGVAVPQTAKIEDYAGFVEEIEQGGGGSSYSYTTGKIRGLQDLGWDEESIGSYNDNLGIYSWEGGSVSEANKALYGVVNGNNLRNYSGNTDMEYLPAFEFTNRTLKDFKYLKGCPKIISSGSTIDVYQFFSGCTNLIVAAPIGTSIGNRTGYMFYGCSSLKSVPKYDTSKATLMSYMFNGCESLTSLPEIDMSACTNADGIFGGCSALKNVKLVNTGSITNMKFMFNGCKSLTSLPEIDMSACVDASYMFSNCSGLTSANLEMDACTDAHNMFQFCSGLTSVHLDMSACTNASEMFYYCSGLTSVELTNTGNITNMNGMFKNCSNLETIPDLDFSKVTDCGSMFDSTKLTSVPDMDLPELTNGRYMFSGCRSLTTVGNLNTPKMNNVYCIFNTNTITSIGEVDFSSVTSLTSQYVFSTSGNKNLTYLGGFKNLKCNWNDNYGLSVCPNLTVQSLLNVLNDLYDFTGHSETPTSSQGKLKLGSANYNKLAAEQIAIGTNKGWTITA